MSKDGNVELTPDGTIIYGLDIIDVVSLLSQKNKKFIALTLQDIEDILGRDHPDFQLIRKVILDLFNDYSRSVTRTLFGDIEDEEYSAE